MYLYCKHTILVIVLLSDSQNDFVKIFFKAKTLFPVKLQKNKDVLLCAGNSYDLLKSTNIENTYFFFTKLILC